MDPLWNPHKLAEELIRILPNMGRWLAHSMRETGEEEAKFIHISILAELQHYPMTTSELAQRRKVSLQAASSMIQGMVQRGWVERVPDPKDRRQMKLHVTTDGAHVAKTVRNELIEVLTRLLSEMSAEEIAAGQQFLPAINRVLSQQANLDELK